MIRPWLRVSWLDQECRRHNVPEKNEAMLFKALKKGTCGNKLRKTEESCEA